MRGRNKHIDFNYGQDSEESDEVSEEKVASKEKKKKIAKIPVRNQNDKTALQKLNASTQANTGVSNFKKNGQLYVVQGDPHFKAITKRSMDDTDLLVNLYNTVVR